MLMAPTPSSPRARIRCPDRSWSGHVVLSLDGLEAVLEPVAGAVDGDHFAEVEESVEDRGGGFVHFKGFWHTFRDGFTLRIRVLQP